jgi:hypothetical protein
MIDSAISDQVFKDAFEVALKAQGINKKDREKIIYSSQHIPVDFRDRVLDIEEKRAREYQAEKKASKKVRSEFEEQCEFVHWFKKTYPGVVIMSIRNGGYRTPRERADQMREGLHPGAADLYIPAWHLWIEFKKVKGGVLSEEQREFAKYVRITCKDFLVLAEGCEQGKLKILEFVENILK